MDAGFLPQCLDHVTLSNAAPAGQDQVGPAADEVTWPGSSALPWQPNIATAEAFTSSLSGSQHYQPNYCIVQVARCTQ
jgi:hypothetical protein